MSIESLFFTIFIGPLKLLFEFIYMKALGIIHNPGLSIITLSICMNVLVLPLYRRADAMQESEREINNKLKNGVMHIKKTYTGDEKMMMLQTYYRQNDYSPLYVIRGSISLLLEIPFFIAAYQFLSHLSLLQGASFGIISDLGSPDKLLSIYGFRINILPIIMTSVNLVSCIIFTKGHSSKTKIQLYGMAIFFFVFLYNSPSGLVFYWTLNNIFSLVKTIFYKLKNSRQIITVMLALIGLCVFGVTFIKFDSINMRRKLFFLLFSIGCIMPFTYQFIQKRITHNNNIIKYFLDKNTDSRKFFMMCALYMTFFWGALIPSSVLKASPQEFIDINYYVNPIWYIVSSVCYSIGTFMIWINVFYWLADKKIKQFFELVLFIMSFVSTVNYMFFGNNLGILSNSLKYEDGILFSTDYIIVNLIIIVLIAIILTFVVCYFKKKLAYIVFVMCIVLGSMSILNLHKINESINLVKNDIKLASENVPSFKLSKNGQNVIVLMLDRALGEYIPYVMSEKPELMDVFSGFTYYPNTISFGHSTNLASPAVFGGYEYCPEMINKRSDELLVTKQNEALKVMPVAFLNHGYEVTVCDPPYAGYQWIPDLSIYDDYPEINTFNTDGYFANNGLKENKIKNNMRNFFCFSIFKSIPIGLQTVVYDDGVYNNSDFNEGISIEGQMTDGLYKAKGINQNFMNAYTVLQNLEGMTNIVDNGNTFLMLTNNTTHEPMLLQKPSYTPCDVIDNTDYENDKYVIEDKILKMDDINQVIHYQSNMAALIEIGKWLEFLKANDVYDNTRIIIVSDHGRELGHFDNFLIANEDCTINLEKLYPLLMVKDFNGTKYSVSEKFMTNADTAILAMDGVIKNGVNPFTGNPIYNDYKNKGELMVVGLGEWDIAISHDNELLIDVWLKVRNDMRDINNWSFVDEE